MMSLNSRTSNLLMVICISLLWVAAESFVPAQSSSFLNPSRQATPLKLNSGIESSFDSSSVTTAAFAIDPTTVLSDILSGLISGPAILAVPILAAVLLGSAIAFFITSYANPMVDDDE